jgi:hypothetical protein
MLRRLYFVLPNETSASATAADLRAAGIDAGHLRIAAREPGRIRIEGVRIQDAHLDRGARIEHSLWVINLLIFAIAALAFAGLLLGQGLAAWLVLPAAVMAATFGAGLRFTRIPNAHLQEFADALRHGELVLMADVPPARVAEIEDRVRRRHPDAVAGGSAGAPTCCMCEAQHQPAAAGRRAKPVPRQMCLLNLAYSASGSMALKASPLTCTSCSWSPASK